MRYFSGLLVWTAILLFIVAELGGAALFYRKYLDTKELDTYDTDEDA